MGFVVGESVGPYTITAYVGQGGMATIYKAHQTTLERDVALKVIHPMLKEDKAFLMRLKREAAIIAKLNHPNIVTVYDYGEFEHTPFLVLQYIEGKTLKAVLQSQKLATRQILNIARAVASALAYAHSRGVLHRDVKPSNILIDQEGHVYLTDFGLARIEHSGESTSSQDMLIGSPHYISPEQAKSETVDARTDIYALGIVLYEMFTGRTPFQGDTPYQAILAQINNPPPAPRAINPKIRPAVEQVLLKALAKEPKERYASIRDMMRALENAVSGPREEDETPVTFPLIEYKRVADYVWPDSLSRVSGELRQRSQRPPLPGILIGVIAFILIGACVVGVALIALQLNTPASLVARPITAAISTTIPNATQIALTASAQPSPTELRPTPFPTATPAPPTPTAIVLTPTPPPPTLPPPTATRLPPSPTRDASTAPAITAPRGKIVYTIATGEAAEQHTIWIADADGTDAKPVIENSNWAALSPDGKQIAYHRIKDEGIYIANSDGSNPRVVIKNETCCVQWSPDGKRLLYVRGKLSIRDTKIIMVNIDGTNSAEITAGLNPAWSPDGNRLVYYWCQPNTTQCGLFVYDMKTKNAALITRDGGGNPQWSPRGDKIVYQASVGGGINIFTINPDGSGQKQLTTSKGNNGQPTWSSDGNFIYYRSDQEGKEWAIFVMRADGTDRRLLISKAPPNANLWAWESLSAGP